MSQTGELTEIIRNQAQKVQSPPVQIGQILTLNPLSVQYQGLELSSSNGDAIYINNLLLDENINLDSETLDDPQTLDPKPWIADNSPNGDYTISGTQKQFLTDFYNGIKALHNRFILHVGDYVALQALGNNTYLILEKVQKIEQ